MVGVFAPRVYAPTVIGRGLTPNYRHEDHPQSCCPAMTRFAASSGMPAAKRYSDIALIGDVESKVLLRKVYCYEL